MFRKNVFNLHLYLALVTSLFLLVICLSGSMLVFELQMDRWLDPSLSFVPRPAGDGSRVPYTAILNQLKDQFPSQQVTELDLGAEGTSVIAKLSGVPTRVFFNPYSGQILGSRPGEPPSYWLRHIHRELAAGPLGAQLVRFTTLVVLFQSVSGVYLWWPLKRVTVNWGSNWRRVNFDLHHAVGFFSSAFVCLIAVTGLIKGYNDQLLPFFDRVTGTIAGGKAIDSKTRRGSSSATMDEAVATAQRQMPGAAIARLTPPKGPNGSFLVTMKYPGDSTAPGRSWVVVDQYSGDVLASQDARTAPLAARIPIINRGIHVGGIMGVPTRILAFLTSISILSQLATGLFLWWRKQGVSSSAPKNIRETNTASV